MKYMNGKGTTIVLGVLSVAFMAWAGVVWSLGQATIAKQTEILVKLATVEASLSEIKKDINQHMNRPWHNEAGEALIRLQEQVTRGNTDAN